MVRMDKYLFPVYHRDHNDSPEIYLRVIMVIFNISSPVSKGRKSLYGLYMFIVMIIDVFLPITVTSYTGNDKI